MSVAYFEYKLKQLHTCFSLVELPISVISRGQEEHSFALGTSIVTFSRKSKVYLTLLLDQRSIDLSGAQEKEGHFHYKNFLRASK